MMAVEAMLRGVVFWKMQLMNSVGLKCVNIVSGGAEMKLIELYFVGE